MPPRKKRVPVVLDTNVIVSYYLGRDPQTANARVFTAWRDRRELQLIASEEIISECLDVLSRLGVPERTVRKLADRFDQRVTVTHVNLGARFTDSRDPDDNLLLATAEAGKAKFLVTNDRDLLSIPAERRRKFRFEIVERSELLSRLAK